MGRRRETLYALGGFVLVALVATYPLVLTRFQALPAGLGDPLLNASILAWDADRLPHAFRGLWDAPYLFPHRYALAYSEHLLGIAVFTAPIYWLTQNLYLAYNAAFVGSYVLAGFGMFLLTRDLWGRTDAALLAGLAFAVTPYRLSQAPHLQVLMNGWMPIALWALHHYFASGARRWLAAFAAAFVLLGFSNGYYFYFFLVPAAVVVAGELAAPRLPRRRIVQDLTTAAFAAAIAVAPVAWPYYKLQREHGFVRTDEEIISFSARLADYFHAPSNGWPWGSLLPGDRGEQLLFHGLTVIVFAGIGVLTVGTRQDTVTGGAWRRVVTTYGVVTVLAVWLSMGPAGGPLYGWLGRIVPGFGGLRVPARLAAVVVVGLAVLAGAGFARVFERIGRRAATITAVAIGAVILIEGQHGVGVMGPPNPHEHNWSFVAYEWLRKSPPGGVLELDIAQQDDFQVYTNIYQMNTVRHLHPIVNGNGGWKSMLQEFLGSPGSPLRDGHAAAVLRGLRAIGVRYVLLHPDTFRDPDLAARLTAEIHAAGDQRVEEHRFGEIWAWRLADAVTDRDAGGAWRRIDPAAFELRVSHQPSRVPFLTDGDMDTRWLTLEPQNGTEWIEVRLKRQTDVARVRLESAPRSLMDYPRGLSIVSTDSSGATRRLFEGDLVERLVRALGIDEQRTPVDVDFPANDTSILRIEQTSQSRAGWSVHELSVWER